MGIYNNVINGVGTYFRAGLVGLIRQDKIPHQSTRDVLDKLRNRLIINEDKIQIPQGKLTLTINDILDEAEATFDYQGESDDYNAPNFDEITDILQEKGYTMEQDGNKYCFSKGKHEINIELQKVKIKIRGKPLFERSVKGVIRFTKYITNCEIIFRDLLGSKKAQQPEPIEQPPKELTTTTDDNTPIPLNDHQYSSPDKFYAALGKEITPDSFKGGETITIGYDGIEIILSTTQNGEQELQSHIQFKRPITSEQVTKYKQMSGFSRLGTSGATYIMGGKPNSGNLRAIIETTIKKYDSLMQNTRNQTPTTPPAE